MTFEFLEAKIQHMSQEPSAFSKKVIQLIKKIPKGRVATYSQIAALAGKPNAARGVVWILNSSSRAHQLPWHRVINAQGKIAFSPQHKNFKKQKALLLKEGIEFVDSQHVDLENYQWSKKASPIKVKARQPKMFSK